MSDIDVIVSAGHDEYALELPDDIATRLWSQADERVEALLDGTDFADDLTDHWTAITGLPNEQRPDADLTYETVIHLHGPRDLIAGALDTLLGDLSSPSGDDDVFDYWPSGIRLAFDVAAALGGEWPNRVTAVAEEVLATMPDFEAELRDKVGLS